MYNLQSCSLAALRSKKRVLSTGSGLRTQGFFAVLTPLFCSLGTEFAALERTKPCQFELAGHRRHFLGEI